MQLHLSRPTYLLETLYFLMTKVPLCCNIVLGRHVFLTYLTKICSQSSRKRFQPSLNCFGSFFSIFNNGKSELNQYYDQRKPENDGNEIRSPREKYFISISHQFCRQEKTFCLGISTREFAFYLDWLFAEKNIELSRRK